VLRLKWEVQAVGIFFNVCHPEVFKTYINMQWCVKHNKTLLCLSLY